MTEEKPVLPSPFRAGNTVQTLTPVRPPEINPSPEFVGGNLGLTGPGSIDGHNQGLDVKAVAERFPDPNPEPWWKDAEVEFSPSQTSMMGLLLDRIERLEDWRETLDERIRLHNIKAQHRL